MPTLVDLEDLKDHLGDTSSLDFPSQQGADDYLTSVLDRVEDMLERATNRTFHASGTATEETHDGNGEAYLYLDRPIESLTDVKVGDDPNDPDETLDTIPDDIQASGSMDRKLLRRDGGVWPRGMDNVHVTYDYAAYQPDVAKQALLEGATFLLRRRGSEHAASTTVGEFGSTEYAALFDRLPAWERATSQLRKRQVA